MAKAIGLIGNYTGKLGNTVGYNLKDSNNKQTQGVRVYQPVVKNPRTAGQAEQRAKLSPINATYHALKDIIDRGQEGKAYGNKSRLAWLSAAMKAFDGGWFEKGAAINMPALVPLTMGSIACDIQLNTQAPVFNFGLLGSDPEKTTTLGLLSTCFLHTFPTLKEGDQITFVMIENTGTGISSVFDSIVLDPTSVADIPSFIQVNIGNIVVFPSNETGTSGAVVVSREGDNGAHLRNTTKLSPIRSYNDDTLTPAAKAAAIASYMSQGANTDWAEESIM